MPEAHVLVTDDNSPDGTGVLADRIAAEDDHVHVLHRAGKQGLGAAYLDAFSWALDRGYDVIVEMDADGSHRPEELPTLLAAIESGADLVLGSRWVEGGRVVNWPRSREVISRGGNTYARLALGISLRDATGGYRAFRAATLKELALDTVESQGYCFQVDLARRAVEHGFTVDRGPDHLRRARGRGQQDEPRHRRRGAVAGHRVGCPDPLDAGQGRSGRRPWLGRHRTGKAEHVSTLLFVLLIVVPAVEIASIVAMTTWIGGAATFTLVVVGGRGRAS